MNMMWALLLGGGVIIAALVVMLRSGPPDPGLGKKTLTVFCAAGLQVPVSEIAKAYEDEYDIHVELHLGGSGSLLNQLQVNKYSEADLYLAADDFYTDKAVSDGLAAETLPLAHQRPVIAVRKDTKKKIRTLDDLLQPGIKIATGNPDEAAIGKAIRNRLQKYKVGDTDRWAQFEEAVRREGVFKPTVNEVANDVKIGSVDAAIVWDSTVSMPKYRDELKLIAIPELDASPNLVSIAVLNSTTNPTAALRFARYVAARDRGLETFDKYGTRPVEGDVWSEKPEITFFCGAVNRRAVESIIDAFQEREGVIVNTKYNGCGTLTSEMKVIEGQSTAKGFPDAYMACDRFYLDNVRDWFQEDVDVSEVEIVLVVPKGSKKVTGLEDLVKPDIRVAIGQPEQCTIGALTRRILQQQSLYDRLMEKQQASGEVVVEKPSSATLVPDVVAGHVDVAVAYISDALPNQEDVDIIRIESRSMIATQPYSIAKTSDNKYLARRLYQRIAAGKDNFEKAGFTFKLDDKDSSQPQSDER